jgi:hypothetical protein
MQEEQRMSEEGITWSSKEIERLRIIHRVMDSRLEKRGDIYKFVIS